MIHSNLHKGAMLRRQFSSHNQQSVKLVNVRNRHSDAILTADEGRVLLGERQGETAPAAASLSAKIRIFFFSQPNMSLMSSIAALGASLGSAKYASSEAMVPTCRPMVQTQRNNSTCITAVTGIKM